MISLSERDDANLALVQRAARDITLEKLYLMNERELRTEFGTVMDALSDLLFVLERQKLVPRLNDEEV